jgi:hypothetical protein
MLTWRRCVVMFFLFLGIVFFAFGCANRSKALLADDYLKMNNDGLLRYYYSLNEEIEKQEKPSGPSLGIGIGGIGSSIGGGVGVGTGSRGYTAEDLRARRIDVKMELQKRGLTP